MKTLLSLTSGIIILSAFAFQAIAKDHGHGHGKGKGHYKHQKHYCSGHCHHERPYVHHVYQKEKVVIVQPQPRPGVTISIPL